MDDVALILPTLEAVVHRPVVEGRDELGIITYSEPEADFVPGVLVEPLGTDLADGSGSERRLRAALKMHVPCDYDASLLDCTVDLPAPYGEGWQVLGDPMPYDPALTPGPWNREARLARTNA